MARVTFFVISICMLAIPAIGDLIEFDDSEVHTINDSRYEYDDITVDYNLYFIPDKPTTTLILLNSGIIGGNISGYHNSVIDIDGGTVSGGIQVLQNSSLEIGSGSIGGNLHARDEGVISIKGGSIDGYMDAFHGGTIYLFGSDFKIGDQELSYGDNLRDYGVIGGQGNDYLTGVITGTLVNGSEISNEFRIALDVADGDIFVVPEPATLSLLVFGFATILRKRPK